MLAILTLAWATELPAELHGHYLREDTVRSWFTAEPYAHGSGALQVSAGGIDVDLVMDSAHYGPVSDEGSGRYTMTGSFPEEETTAVFARDAEGRLVLTLGDTRWLRAADHLPAVADVEPDTLATGALLGKGWVGPDGPVVFLSEDERHLALGGPDLQGGFGFNDVFTVEGVDYVFTVEDGTLRLEEAAEEDGPERYARDGGRTIELTRMDAPPFLVLADRLNLREKPSPKSPVVQVVEGGSWVSAWRRLGGWVVVEGEGKVGWGSADYLARRTSPAGAVAEDGHFTVEHALTPGDPITVRTAPGGAGCDVGGQSTPPIPGSRGARVRVTDLDDERPLDVICLVESAGGWVACPFLRDGHDVEATPCGVVGDFPASVSSARNGPTRTLILGDEHFEKGEAGWFDGTLPEAPPEAAPEPSVPEAEAPAPAEDSGGAGCMCATVALGPLVGGWWLLPLALRRQREVVRV